MKKIYSKAVKKCFVLGCGLALCTTMASVPARAEDNSEVLQQILQQLNTVNQRFDKIENRLHKLESSGNKGTGSVSQDTQYMKEDIDEIFERLDQTEKKTMMDKINLGASIRTRMDNFHYENNDADTEENNDNFISSRFRLRMNADVNDNIKFHGRVSVYRNWGDYDSYGDVDNTYLWDANYSGMPTDTTMRLDRAYVDFLFRDLLPIPVALTVGRQPTVGGPPEHLKDDTSLRSTYPSLFFQREVDAACLTFGLSQWTQLDESVFRVMYGKFLQPDNDTAYYMDDHGEDVHLLWLQAETKLPGKWNTTSLYLTYIRNWNMPGAPMDDVTAQDDNLGWNENYGFTLMSDDFYNSGIDWFVSVCRSKAHSSDHTIYITKPDGKKPTFGMFSGPGNMGESGKDRTGLAYYLGLRYKLPWDAMNGAKVGLEYNHGSKYWWAPLKGTEDPLNKLGTKGEVWDVYYLQPFMHNAMFRLGMTDIQYDHKMYGGPIGYPSDIDQELVSYYFVLDVNF